MNANYDKETDTLTIVFKPGDVIESDEEKPGMILDYDSNGHIIGLEILDASKIIPDVTQFHFSITNTSGDTAR